MTTIYLIRHSVRLPLDLIENNNSNQNKTILNEKIILSVEGEKRAEKLANEDELKNIDVVYASNSVRSLQTAKYLMANQNLKVTIDDRLDERRTGKPNDNEIKDWWTKQYLDEDYKTVGGESQKDVRIRYSEAFNEIIKRHKDKRIAVFSHGYAITFFLLKYCKLLEVKDKKLTLEYNGKIIFDKRINAPEVFKITVNNEKVTNIELIEFDDLPYNHGV